MAARLPVLGPQGLIFRPRDRYFPRRLLCFPPPRPPMLRLWSAEYRTFEGEATAYRMCRDFLVTDCCADTTFPVSVGADLSHFVKRHAYVVINHPNSEHSPAACDMPFHTMCQFGRDAFHCNSAGDVLRSPTQVTASLSLTCIVDLRVTFPTCATRPNPATGAILFLGLDGRHPRAQSAC